MSAAAGECPSLCQVAIVSLDAARSMRFYCQLLGFEQTGHLPVRGKTAARMMGEPAVQGVHYWLAGAAPFFQFEVFHFDLPRAASARRGNADYGYNRLAVEVADVDAAFSALCGADARALLAPHGPPGQRRALIADPDDIVIELLANPAVGAAGRLVGVGATVPSLAEARRYLEQGFGIRERTARVLADDGGDDWRPDLTLEAGTHWLELTERLPPEGGTPGLPPMVQQGLMNIALGVRAAPQFKRLFAQVLRHGYRPAAPPVSDGVSSNAYIVGPVPVELLQLPTAYDGLWGFRRPGLVGKTFQGIVRFFLNRL